MINESFPTKEWMSLLNQLQNTGTLFYKLWSVGRPRWNDQIPTAQVSFDEDGNFLNFDFNEKFYWSLTNEQRLFVVCHEILHLLYFHGPRIISLTKSNPSNKVEMNKAADLIVNHRLVDYYQFEQSSIDPDNKYCWFSTLFPDTNVNEVNDLSFEELFKLLKQKAEENKQQNQSNNGQSGSNSEELVDDHSTMSSENSEKLEKFINENFSQEEKNEVAKEFKNDENVPGKEAGTSSNKLFKFVPIVKVEKKKKWETIINKWVAYKLSKLDKESWTDRKNSYRLMSNEYCLPTELELEAINKEKIKIFMFLDTSGSCSHLAERFFKAAESIPDDFFDIRLFCFDTAVYETNMKSRKLYGFGGTSFQPIENKIIELCKQEQITYPDGIFVITDGCGTAIKPLYPDRYHWFLTENFLTYIPSKSKTYMLSDFE